MRPGARILSCIMLSYLLLVSTAPCAAANVQYIYDDLNRLIRVEYPDGMETVYTYDEVGNRISRQAAMRTYLITASVTGNGTVVPSSATVDYGDSLTFIMTPNTGHHILNVLVDGDSVGAVASYTFADITAPHTIQVSFAINTYSITTAVDGGFGTISPNSAVVNYGGNKTFTVTPGINSYVADVEIDGISKGPMGNCTFTNVSADHTLSASFRCTSDPVVNARTSVTYAGLQEAYNAAMNGDTLLCQGVRLIENFTASRNISVTIDGGYQCDFSSNPDMTRLQGSTAINSGTVDMRNFIITD